jgi:hypothetical protein
MRRTVLAWFVLLTLNLSSAVAQTCRGLPSFNHGPVQILGEGTLSGGSNTMGAGIGFGLRSGPFGELMGAKRFNDAFSGSSVELGGGAGYEIVLGGGRRFSVCPMASAVIGIGPNNVFGSRVERSSRSALLGLSVATTVVARQNWEVIPSLGLSYAYRNDRAQDQTGASLFEISDHYALARVGVGFAVRSNFSIRPQLDLPLATDGGEPAIGLTVGYNFGKRRSPARQPLP